jgi:hypothetical protein
LGDRAGALRTWQRALHILDDLAHPDAHSLRDRLDHAAGRCRA